MSKRKEPERKIPTVRMAKPTGRPIQLRYTDPDTGKEVRITTGTHDPEEAKQHLDQLKAKLLLGIEAKPKKRKAGGKHMAWEEFRERFSTGHLAGLRRSSLVDGNSRLNVIERIAKPRTLADLATSESLHDLQNDLLAGVESRKGRPRSPHTVKTYMAVMIAALNWAQYMGWLDSVPKVRKVKTSKLKHMKGRPITTEEFERMLMATTAVVGAQAAPSWQHLLKGLWESGLRIDELMHVSWDDSNCIMPVWQRGALPVLAIPAPMQKNDTEESIPMVAGLEELLQETPEAERCGWVFNPGSLRTKHKRRPSETRPHADWVGKVVSRIGEKAGIVVEPAKGKPDAADYRPTKYATAHDFRRGFADRLAAAGVSERDLAAIMRHANVETTRKHYAPGNVQRTAGAIRERLATVPRYNKAAEEVEA